jgi:cyclohexa-1,5-dienecarbonyl-CoA hydratase
MIARPDVDYACADRIARVTLTNPPDNQLGVETIRAIGACIAQAHDDGASVLVLGSEDARTFSAGIAPEALSRDCAPETLRALHEVYRALYATSLVTIAKVRGRCLGGGCELALFCDIVVAADTAVFGLPEIDRGGFPPVALSAFPYRFGRTAVELVLTGSTVAADEALRAGLVSRWVPRDELEDRVEELAASLAAKSAPVLALTVRTARSLWSPGFERALDDAERTYLDELVQLPDYREGLNACVEGREPHFASAAAPAAHPSGE